MELAFGQCALTRASYLEAHAPRRPPDLSRWGLFHRFTDPFCSGIDSCGRCEITTSRSAGPASLGEMARQSSVPIVMEHDEPPFRGSREKRSGSSTVEESGGPTGPIRSSKPEVGAIYNAEENVLGKTRLTAGNLRNNHFYLKDFLDAFPHDTIGGRNRSEAAVREVSIDWGGPHIVSSDIDATKRMFRRRGWVGHFFSASKAQEGDTVVLTSPSPYQVRVYLERTAIGKQ